MSEHAGESEGRSPSDATEPRNVDELRRQLRALGYLDAGVDRFLLAPAQESRRPVALAFRSSLRVGILAGLLLGPAAAIGVGGRVPGLVSGGRDAFVIALYLAIIFFVAFAAIAFIASLSARVLVRAADGRFGRRARLATDAIGWTIAIGCLTYLTFWWRNANAGFGWSAPLWTTFALVVAAGISLLIGHAIRITALAVLAAAHPAAELPRVPSKSWRIIVVGGTLALAGAAALLLATATPAAAPAVTPQLTVVKSRAPIRLIALDGFDPATYTSLTDGVDLPTLEFLLGGVHVTLHPQNTSDPARAWTTIATGVTPAVHGVHAIEARRVTGLRGVIARTGRVAQVIGTASDLLRLTQPSLVTSEQRQAKTIWEVADEAGLRTAVVDWWATWPAPATGDIVITDRALLRLERGGALDGEIAPASLYPTLQAAWPSIRAHAASAAAGAFSTGDPATAAILRRSAELDASVAGIAQALAPQKLDLFVVYLPGLDIAQYALLGPSAGTLTPSAMAARVAALRSYYPFLDRLLGPLTVPVAGQTIMLVTQPGRAQTETGGLFAVAPPERPHFEGDVGGHASIQIGENFNVDVAPTLWWALGLPLSRELPGKPATDLFENAQTIPERYIPTYGRPYVTAPPRTGKPLDQEMIDRLRSLGYVK